MTCDHRVDLHDGGELIDSAWCGLPAGHAGDHGDYYGMETPR